MKTKWLTKNILYVKIFMEGDNMGLKFQMGIKKNILIIRLDGEFDQSSVQKLKEKVNNVMDKYQIKYLIFNFDKVNFMDSTGIGFIISRYTEIKRRKGIVFICSMNRMVERIFNLSGLCKICFVTKEERDAIKYLEIA